MTLGSAARRPIFFLQWHSALTYSPVVMRISMNFSVYVLFEELQFVHGGRRKGREKGGRKSGREVGQAKKTE